MELWERDAWEIADAVRSREISAAEVVDVHLARIERLDGDVNSWCDVDAEGARRRAAEIDAEIASGHDPGPLAGVPLGVKGTQAAAGLLWDEGSRLYAGRRADHDCALVARLRAAGAVVVGATTAPEFGSVNWTRTFVHGTTRNPWNLAHTPGGSSGGSAAAVAAGMVPLATGGDGGGSIRIPSAYSGLFGFKPTFGRIGLGPDVFDTSLTVCYGPMCRSVRDAARFVDVTAGAVPTDPTSIDAPTGYEHVVAGDDVRRLLQGRRAAWSATLGRNPCDPEVEKVAHEAALALADDAGLDLVEVEVDLPRPGAAWAAISTLSVAVEHGDELWERFDELTPVVRLGLDFLRSQGPEGIARAWQRRHELLAALARLFEEVDVLLTPTTATVALAAEGNPPAEIAGRRVGGMGSVPFTAPFNLSGQPAVSIPCGFVDGLPVGLQVVARRFEEPVVLAAGRVAEQARPWPKLAPLAGG
jgi:aspartyl-tRNA(Asn)/glutamyl-tRNA(Gln) amidotransferase subunit A